MAPLLAGTHHISISPSTMVELTNVGAVNIGLNVEVPTVIHCELIIYYYELSYQDFQNGPAIARLLYPGACAMKGLLRLTRSYRRASGCMSVGPLTP
jgi:hypothetical protein